MTALLSLLFLAVIWGRTVLDKRRIFNFESVLEFKVLFECFRNKFRDEAILETANRLARICNRA
jgi:hypothetical protein